MNHPPTRSLSHGSLRLVLITFSLAALLFLTACGGTPPPSNPDPSEPEPGTLVEVSGHVELPAGHSLKVNELRVITANGDYPVDATGTFTAEIFAGAETEIGIETGTGDLVLLTVSDGAEVVASATSTAEALLYYLVGGAWLPAEQQDQLRTLLRDRSEATAVASELSRLLSAGGNGLLEPDDALEAALAAAWQSLLGEASAVVQDADAGGTLSPASTDNIIIEPSDTAQAGAKVLHNPAGSGLVAQNTIRRPGALLAYEVEWEDANGVTHAVEPPQLRQVTDVPVTGKLELFTAIGDVLTGDAPWSPVLSEKVVLPNHEGAARTHYELVLLGPSTDTAPRPIYSDPRFTDFHDDWDGIIADKALELFLDEMALPLLESFAFGRLAMFDAGKLKQVRNRFRALNDPHLAKLGVFLKSGRYASAMRVLIEELATNNQYRLDFMDLVRDALEESDRAKVNFDALERRLSTRARASAITTAVQVVLMSSDMTAILVDLASAPSAVSWSAITAPTLFFLTPEHAFVRRNYPQVKLTVATREPMSGNFLFRWTTTGRHGTISDLLSPDSTRLVTEEQEVWYFHDSPRGINDEDMDTVTVEVFEVEAGATSIPAGALPIARLVAVIEGDDRINDGSSRIAVEHGASTDIICAGMFLHVPKEEGAGKYLIKLRDFGGVGSDDNPNDLLRRGGDHNLTITVDDTGAAVGKDGFYTHNIHDSDISDVGNCRFQTTPFGFLFRDDIENDEYLITIYIMQYWKPEWGGLGKYVGLWYDWVSQGTIEVTFERADD